MKNLHLDAFCQFWESNFNSPIPPMPKKPTDLTITQCEQLRIYDGGKLYQNLFSVKPESGNLPAGVERDISNGRIDIGKKDLYRQHGYEEMAQRIEKAQVEYEQNKLNKEIEESRARQEQQQQKREQWKNMSLLERMAAEPLTQDQILRNRKRYGVGQ